MSRHLYPPFLLYPLPIPPLRWSRLRAWTASGRICLTMKEVEREVEEVSRKGKEDGNAGIEWKSVWPNKKIRKINTFFFFVPNLSICAYVNRYTQSPYIPRKSQKNREIQRWKQFLPFFPFHSHSTTPFSSFSSSLTTSCTTLFFPFFFTDKGKKKKERKKESPLTLALPNKAFR